MRRALTLAIVAALVASSGCAGDATQTAAPSDTARNAASGAATTTDREPAKPPPAQALVTTENQNEIAVIGLSTGRILSRIEMPADPEFVASDRRFAVITSPDSGAVSVLDRPSLRPIRVLRDFAAPHIAELSADGRYAYVTDDDRGRLYVIRLRDARVVGSTAVGAGAHHLAVEPDGRQVWIALGESARTIVVVDTSVPSHPRVVTSFDPGFEAHDLTFTPDGREVWITSSSGSDIGVFSATSRRLRSHVPGGASPQHVVFSRNRAYVSSGYGSQLEMADIKSGHVLQVAHAPYGSFNLAAADGFVTASSLLRGTVAVYDDKLRLLHVRRIAPAARDVAISAAPSPR